MTTKRRAALAAEFIRRRDTRCRDFDGLFEMGDGAEVVRLLVSACRADATLADNVTACGLGDWLRPASE
jgi:hypothetical protein